MRLTLTSHKPPHKQLFVAVLVSGSSSQSFTQRLASWSLDLPLAELGEKGQKRLFAQSQHPVLCLGLGATPSVENLRQAAHQAITWAETHQAKALALMSDVEDAAQIMALAEVVPLSTYRFDTYQSKPKPQHLRDVFILGPDNLETSVQKVQQRSQATNIARDLVNEPVITLTATELAQRCTQLGSEHGFQVEVLGKRKIEALGMGGLLAVNSGSLDPPTFTIMEYCPSGMEATPPIVLVGKGVVYDTGGLSLKPTANSMDFMKADMGGAAAVIGTMCGLANQGVTQRVIGLVPATDNRPGQRAYTPGDVIQMYDGSTVEVLNTDAEGRMILADALAYAKQYAPQLVIDLATLTGAQVVAIGRVGAALMGTADADVQQNLVQAGEAVYERLVPLPLWDEYTEMLRSDIADVKNIGGRDAGSITAGAFLQRFTDYPWVHLDIAGPTWLSTPDSYRGKGGTGFGVRLLLHFLSQL